MSNNCVPEILDLLGKVDALLDMVDDLSITFDEFSGNEEFLTIVGGANSFQTMKNISLLKSILHSITAILMETSRAQALKYEKDNGPVMHPSAPKNINQFINKIIMAAEAAQKNQEAKEKDNTDSNTQLPEEKLLSEESEPKRQNRSPEEENVIAREKEKRRSQEKQNKHLGNAMDYFKEKFLEEEDNE